MIQDPGYCLLKSRLISVTGLSYYRDRDEDFVERIGARLSELGLPNCTAYSNLLDDENTGPDEFVTIAARLNIGETYFFRDREQFDAIRDVIVPEILNRNQSHRTIRIWCAGCANGAEPYSLAILLESEFKDRLADWKVSILGTDISRQALAEAESGKYGQWALRCTTDVLRGQCFSSAGGSFVIRPEYRKWVSFARMNLADGWTPSSSNGIGNFDLILCRNVMIYFAPELKSQLLVKFHDSLTPGGWLLVGAVEHDLENFKTFRSVSSAGVTLYQNHEPWRSVYSDFSPVDIPPARVLPTFPLPLIEPVHAEASQADEKADAPCLDELRELAGRGDWQSARSCCDRLLAVDVLNPIVHFYHALTFEHLGVPAASERSLRQAIYLDRRFALAHYHLGLSLAKEKQTIHAARALRNALLILSEASDDAVVQEGGGVTAAELKMLTKKQLEILGVL